MCTPRRIRHQSKRSGECAVTLALAMPLRSISREWTGSRFANGREFPVLFSAQRPPPRPRKAWFLAGAGLLVVAVFTAACPRLSPVRVAYRRSYLVTTEPKARDIVNSRLFLSSDEDRLTFSHLNNIPVRPRVNVNSIDDDDETSVRSSPSNILRSLWGWAQSLLRPRGNGEDIDSESDAVMEMSSNSSTIVVEGNMSTQSTTPAPPLKRYLLGNIHGVDVAYSRMDADAPRGIAVLFHACGQQSEDWFELPEHRKIVQQLRKDHIALIALSSDNTVSRCWSTRFPASQNEDVARVTMAVRQWIHSYDLQSIPMYGIGISSGGTLLSILSTSELMPRFASQVLYISPGSMRAFKRASKTYPNTLFAHFRNDNHYASQRAVNAACTMLLRRGVRLVGEMPLSGVRLQPLTMHLREPRFSERQSRHIFRILTSSATNFSRSRPISGRPHGGQFFSYEDAVRRHAADPEITAILAEQQSRRALEQLSRVLSGRHEVVATGVEKVSSWLVTHARPRSR
jgi:hypothetical protein